MFTYAQEIIGLHEEIEKAIELPISQLSASKLSFSDPDFTATNTEDAIKEVDLKVADLSVSVLTMGEKVEDATTYSTDEKIVGTWVDGVDVYEKTIIINSLGYSTANTFLEVGNIVNCNELLALNGIIWNSAGTKARELPFISTEVDVSNTKFATLTFEKIAEHGNDNAIMFYSNDTWATAKIIITVKYTKITQ